MRLSSKLTLAALIVGGLFVGGFFIIRAPRLSQGATAMELLRTCKIFQQTARRDAQGLIVLPNQDAAACYNFFAANHSHLATCLTLHLSIVQLIGVFIENADKQFGSRLYEDATHFVTNVFPCKKTP